MRKPYDYKYKEKKEEKEEKVEEIKKENNSLKQMFFNSKIDNNKEGNLKELDSTDDLFIGKYMKYTSSPSLGFNSSNENSLQNMPYVPQKQRKEEEEEEKVEEEPEEKNEEFLNNDNDIQINIIEKTTEIEIEETIIKKDINVEQNIEKDNKEDEINDKDNDNNEKVDDKKDINENIKRY